MSRPILCDGCGARLDRAVTVGRHDVAAAGGFAPPADFDWCRTCSRVAFEAVHAAVRDAVEQRRRRRDRGAPVTVVVNDRPTLGGSPPVGGPPAPAGVGGVLSWLPGRRSWDEDAGAAVLQGHRNSSDVTAVWPRPRRRT